MYLIKTIRALVFRALTLALAAAALSSCFAFDDDSVTARENADDSVKISYLGKGYAVGVAFYGDLFRVEAPEDFTYDLVVLTAGAYNQYGSASALVNRYTESLVRTLEMNHTNLEDYLLHGNYNNGEQILPRGDYTVYAIGIDMDGKPTGALYSKPFTVKSYVDFKLDGKLERQFDWDAVYLGRYQSTDYDGNPVVIITYTFPLQKHNDVIMQNCNFRSLLARGQNTLKSVYINLKRIFFSQNRKKKSHGSFCTQNSIID